MSARSVSRTEMDTILWFVVSMLSSCSCTYAYKSIEVTTTLDSCHTQHMIRWCIQHHCLPTQPIQWVIYIGFYMKSIFFPLLFSFSLCFFLSLLLRRRLFCLILFVLLSSSLTSTPELSRYFEKRRNRTFIQSGIAIWNYRQKLCNLKRFFHFIKCSH